MAQRTCNISVSVSNECASANFSALLFSSWGNIECSTETIGEPHVWSHQAGGITKSQNEVNFVSCKISSVNKFLYLACFNRNIWNMKREQQKKLRGFLHLGHMVSTLHLTCRRTKEDNARNLGRERHTASYRKNSTSSQILPGIVSAAWVCHLTTWKYSPIVNECNIEATILYIHQHGNRLSKRIMYTDNLSFSLHRSTIQRFRGVTKHRFS